MTELLLREGEQCAVRAIIATEPVPGSPLPGEDVLQHLARLFDCEAIGIALLDGSGSAVGEVALPRHRDTGRAAPGPHRGPQRLVLGVRNGPHHVVQLWMVRGGTGFTARERALLTMVAPALERLLRERPTPGLPVSLTTQERRVLQHVAAGMTNAEVAQRMFVAPSTVRKHLENAYRKLGVSNRLAAVAALERARLPQADAERASRAEIIA
jgi:DNA-binding CsgD family transcriptional regulator